MPVKRSRRLSFHASDDEEYQEERMISKISPKMKKMIFKPHKVKEEILA